MDRGDITRAQECLCVFEREKKGMKRQTATNKKNMNYLLHF